MMAELLVLLQALLLVAGWLLFLRAQTELRAQAARQSLTGEMEELRRTIEILLQRLTSEAEAAEARVQACIATLQSLLEQAEQAPSCQANVRHPTLQPLLEQADNRSGEPCSPPEGMETSTPAIGYNLSERETRSFGMVAILAQQGLSIQDIALQTGYAPGEVELILNLQRRHEIFLPTPSGYPGRKISSEEEI